MVALSLWQEAQLAVPEKIPAFGSGSWGLICHQLGFAHPSPSTLCIPALRHSTKTICAANEFKLIRPSQSRRREAVSPADALTPNKLLCALCLLALPLPGLQQGTGLGPVCLLCVLRLCRENHCWWFGR